ncbi:NUDIX hydrolase [Bacillus carboniphilus]|uniref:NUDIX hydrolase n=1 Tax=Bacillus carboniphilus TaxID=86663 RepID=A0ABY9JRR8_9BACI|nr:NUDIX hydrolase [Bacillus carboniphilus]WLR42099.1 NUDIX hydrolase [Bacillus carboniphilus]
MSDQWIEWAKKLQSIAQAGLTFSKDEYDLERYQQLRDLSAEIMSEHTDYPLNKIKDFFANDKGYQTPKLDVRGVVFKEDKILMVKERLDNRWSLPGGFCDIGLSASENIVKEIKEESGFNVNPTKLLALLHMNKHPHPPQPFDYYKIFIQCEITGGKAKSGLETNEVKFFEQNLLPPLSTRRNTQSQINMLFEFLTDRNKPAIFD